uniref:Uncharacterized protein n=1 Tax=Oryza barthii TaxID=65489 RepID=A0A0D3ES37_9ORYZ
MDVVAPVMGIGSEEMAVGMRMRRRFTPIVWDPRGSRHWTLGGGDSSGALHGRKMVQWWRSRAKSIEKLILDLSKLKVG